MKKYAHKLFDLRFRIFKKRTLTFSVGFALAILCFLTLNAGMRPVSKSEYCGINCHEMDTAYQTWKLSVHGGNKRGLQGECIDCHLPAKDKYFTHIIAKAYEGGRDMFQHYYHHYFGGKYDVEKAREKVLNQIKNDKCTCCHVNLLVKPSSEMAKEAHTEALTFPDNPDSRCIECHEDVGHQR